MGDQTEETKDLSPTESKPPAKTPQSKLGKRQASVQAQPLQRESQVPVSRRNSQPTAPGSARPRLQNGPSKIQGRPSSRPTTSATSARVTHNSDAGLGTSSTMPGDGSAAPERKPPKASLPKTSRREHPNNRPDLGKGRLERGKQISHLGLFPLSGQVQRQSTSMNAEAGSVDADHAAELDEASSATLDKKPSGSWRKQIDHLTRSLTEYAENHPQFSSQLSSCRLDKILGLRTVKTLKGDQLTINVTLSISTALFDLRARSAKTKSLANIRHKSVDGADELTNNQNSNRDIRRPDVRISTDDDKKEAEAAEKSRNASAGNGGEPDSSAAKEKTEANDFTK